MARIRQVLGQQQVAAPAAAGSSRLRPYPPQAESQVEQPVEIPYIEVGGTAGAIDASPSVLACPPVRQRRSAGQNVNPAPKSAEPEEKAQSGKAPATAIPSLQFHPVPGDLGACFPGRPSLVPELFTYHQPDHPTAREYRQVLADLENTLEGSTGRVVLLLPVDATLDATAIALNLAITAAQNGPEHSVVIEACAGRPRMASYLGLSSRSGLSDVLAGRTSLPHALQPTAQANLSALPVGRDGSSLSLERSSAAFKSLLNQVREQAERILVIGPVWDGGPACLAAAAACDALCLLVPATTFDAQRLPDLTRPFTDHRLPLCGCIVQQ